MSLVGKYTHYFVIRGHVQSLSFTKKDEKTVRGILFDAFYEREYPGFIHLNKIEFDNSSKVENKSHRLSKDNQEVLDNNIILLRQNILGLKEKLGLANQKINNIATKVKELKEGLKEKDGKFKINVAFFRSNIVDILKIIYGT